MKKFFLVLGICMMLLLATGVFAESLSNSEDVNTVVKKVSEKRGIKSENIKEIKKVDFNKLPEEVKIENLDNTNLAMYEVNYGEEKPVYVITVSDEKFEKTVETIIAKTMLLNFGISGEVSESEFLNTATEIQTSEEKGYVMMRDGSLTGISTNLEVLQGSGEIEIILYKNQKPSGFRNTIVVENSGIKKDYDVQSEGVLTFEKGDVISTYVNVNGQINLKDVITLVEIVTD